MLIPYPVLPEADSPAHPIDLTGSALLVSNTSRKLLDYIVQCALPEGTMAVAHHDGQTYRFRGTVGIAPEWRSGALSVADQAAVTACLLARTNAFGVPVLISMRGVGGDLAGLQTLRATKAEQQAFPLWEGAFFGNIFADPPRAYACRGDVSSETEAALRRARRICTLPSAEITSSGQPISSCGFVVLGPCASDAARLIRRGFGDQAMDVYLPR
ncbi:hypothetical protein [Sulfitobacter sp. DFL-23]|nr:hypothetical protein [Sulfitobacter sp. DFL-23]